MQPFFDAGLVLDAIDERAVPEDEGNARPSPTDADELLDPALPNVPGHVFPALLGFRMRLLTRGVAVPDEVIKREEASKGDDGEDSDGESDGSDNDDGDGEDGSEGGSDGDDGEDGDGSDQGDDGHGDDDDDGDDDGDYVEKQSSGRSLRVVTRLKCKVSKR